MDSTQQWSDAMSASKTNLEKQIRRHAGPLIGIALALIVASGLFLGYLAYEADTDEAAPAAQEQIEGTNGIPATGAPATPLSNPTPAPSVIDEPAAPPD